MGVFPSPFFLDSEREKIGLPAASDHTWEDTIQAPPKSEKKLSPAGPTAARAYWLRNLYSLPAPEVG